MSFPIGNLANGALLIGVHSCPFVVRRFPLWITLVGPSRPFVDHSFFFCFRQAPPLPCRADHPRVKHPSVNKDEPRMNTNRHKDRWTCLAATPSREEAPRERGRPARTTLAQPRPSPRPDSTGNGATISLQPSPGRSRRQGGRVPHHGKAERPPNAENAGETPALPEGRLLPSFLLREEALPLPMRQRRSASCAFVVLRVSSWIPLFCLFQGIRFGSVHLPGLAPGPG